MERVKQDAPPANLPGRQDASETPMNPLTPTPPGGEAGNSGPRVPVQKRGNTRVEAQRATYQPDQQQPEATNE